VLCSVLRQVFKNGKHALGAALTDGAHIAAFLKNFARDVKRKVGGINHALHETQVGRKKLLRIIHDEYALHVQLHTTASISIPEIERCALGYIQRLRDRKSVG